VEKGFQEADDGFRAIPPLCPIKVKYLLSIPNHPLFSAIHMGYLTRDIHLLSLQTVSQDYVASLVLETPRVNAASSEGPLTHR